MVSSPPTIDHLPLTISYETSAMTEIETLLSGYTHRLEMPILWGYMDAMQHVNNTLYFRFFESARISYFDATEKLDPEGAAGKGLILHSANCRFRIPLTYPDTVTVAIRATEMYHDRLTMYHIIVSHQHQKIAAEGSCIVVGYDYNTLSKAPLTPKFRQFVLDLDQPEVIN